VNTGARPLSGARALSGPLGAPVRLAERTVFGTPADAGAQSVKSKLAPTVDAHHEVGECRRPYEPQLPLSFFNILSLSEHNPRKVELRILHNGDPPSAVAVTG
jgi:hypothetical protein